jgi:RNA polymerase sigma-70 factor (ECF subfamily)
MSSTTESELIERCLRGDTAAWDELFAIHYDPVARFVFQLSPDFTREDAEEICQEVFLSVIKNLSGFQGGSRLQTWIFRVASNKARDVLEKRNAGKRGGGATPLSLQAEDPETGLTLDPPAPLPGPDTLLAKAEQQQMLLDALGKMENECRELLELRYFAGLSYEELATELHLNSKTVSSRLSRCLDRLEAIATKIFSGQDTAFPV